MATKPKRKAKTQAQRLAIADSMRNRWIAAHPDTAKVQVPYPQIQREVHTFLLRLAKHLRGTFEELELIAIDEAFIDAIGDLKQPSLLGMALEAHFNLPKKAVKKAKR
jgi:hypothetical protein